VQVQCYAGRKADEWPVRFWLEEPKVSCYFDYRQTRSFLTLNTQSPIMPTPTKSSGATAKHPWVYRASIPKLLVVAALLGVLIWIVNAGLDLLWAKYNGMLVVLMGFVDALISFAFAAVLFKLMLAARARHRKVVQRLETIAEMNHEIRNALEEIQLTVHLTQNEQVIQNIRGAVQRIEWALREVLPKETPETKGRT
jgi:signal transduction histidine kinase